MNTQSDNQPRLITAETAANLDGFGAAADLRTYARRKGLPPAYRAYALEKARAMIARANGNIPEALRMEHNCEIHYSGIPADWRW